MRLPENSALILIDWQEAILDGSWGARNRPDAPEAARALLAAWRAVRLPTIHVHHASQHARSPDHERAPGHRALGALSPVPEEAVFRKAANSAFADRRLDAHLTERGITHLVLSGVLTENSVEATVRGASDLGYSAILAFDACQAAEKRDLAGKFWTADEVEAVAIACMVPEYGGAARGARWGNLSRAGVNGGTAKPGLQENQAWKTTRGT